MTSASVDEKWRRNDMVSEREIKQDEYGSRGPAQMVARPASFRLLGPQAKWWQGGGLARGKALLRGWMKAGGGVPSGQQRVGLVGDPVNRDDHKILACASISNQALVPGSFWAREPVSWSSTHSRLQRAKPLG